MSEVSPETEDSILILNADAGALNTTVASISNQIPSVIIEAVQSIDKLRDAIENRDFDIVVIDHSPGGPSPIELIHELRMRENEPSVLVISDSQDPRFFAEVYNHGGQRCIVKDEKWLPELGPTIRQALRMRKLKDRNRELQARLVEANMLLEEKNRRLDEFSATVAHDIRGPLGGLSMKLEYIVETYQGKLDKRCEQLLRTGLGSVERLSRIVQGMYEYAKLGAKAAEMSSINLVNLVQEVIGDTHFDPSRDIRVGVGELPKVWGNDDLLRRLCMNLLNNAVKYNDSEIVVINVRPGKKVQNHLAEFVEIVFEDNGRGIPEDELDNVFGMFQRGSSAGPETEGTGIGLAIVQRIAELHYGKARVESNVGKGTRFYISLPLERIDFVK